MGDSYRRQTEAATRYAAEHGLELDERSFEDLGISAYSGKNAEVGALRTFLVAAEDGIIPRGSFLLVESLDRISRGVPRKSLRLLEEICEAGITVVTLTDNRRYDVKSLDQDFTSLMFALLTAARAHEESATKGLRVRAAWEAKRKRARCEPLTARAPAWLKLDRTKHPPEWRVLRDRAKVVRRIFKMAESGAGQDNIAVTLNREGVPTFGRSKMWHRSYVQKILASNAVIGTFLPHTLEHDGANKKLRVPSSGGAVAGYYPRIISDDVFNNVRVMRLDGRRQPSTKPNLKPAHMLSGLARCGLCGGSMTRVYKGRKGGKPKLVCMAAKMAKGCKYVSVSVDDVERAIAASVGYLVGNAPSGEEQLDAKLEKLDTMRAAIDEMIENLVDEIQMGNATPQLRERLNRMVASKNSTKKEYEAVVEKIASASRESVQKRLDRFEMLVEGEADKAEINAALRQVAKAVVVEAENGRLRFQWEQGGETILTFGWPSEG